VHLVKYITGFVGGEFLEKVCCPFFVESFEDVSSVMRVVARELLPRVMVGIEVVLGLIRSSASEFADR
jgi:hypothetical protein